MAVKKKTKFMCQSCGYESAKWMGKCPGCGEWNKMVEETEIVKPARKGAFTNSEVRGSGEREKAAPITTIQSEKEPRIKTDLMELNRALGGGIVQGSLVLIGGIRVSVNRPYFCRYLPNWRINRKKCFIYQAKNQSSRPS